MGVEIATTTHGDGVTFPKTGQTVTAHYVGALPQTRRDPEFDSSRKRGRPFQFTIGVGQVIRGWDEGMMQMSVGEKATLTCTPDYGYGPNGMPPVIPPNSTLVFDVELISVQ
ncbi:uncharacterized protein MICPUCDRAFT_17740 [Micromonas pusilla CCMP1545]|uniref:peptidylprolyl isomerase n=1 Tax=Micromonas pusilla (strain CCMP1545) TaxID=564608 RepID=C1MV44_MICPC|nr:uncharacterized protein MICPUCDRAFT_17740 [Micromonas pusilla CCMP1545]EEH56736.1 predicted protein [Micromonas pusilla CCMP1545]|eukprot:XP_003059604.1 predicted protein [Micromonas pusilla CCMP1545]